jgi:hypothetical protein
MPVLVYFSFKPWYSMVTQFKGLLNVELLFTKNSFIKIVGELGSSYF